MLTKKNLFLVLMVLLSGLIIFSCGRKGSMNPNEAPHIEITSYNGTDSLDSSVDSLRFRQEIYWNATDPDGVIDGYAFRVLDEDGNPIATPGFEYIDEDGWVYHYKEGVEVTSDTPPPSDPEYGTIWTNQVYAEISFPANIDGEPANVISKFEVKCRDNKHEESQTDSRYFKAFSKKAGCILESTGGSMNHKTIGTGIMLDFSTLSSGDYEEPYVGQEALYYEFKLEKIDQDGNVIVSNYPDQWYSTEGFTNIERYPLTTYTEPALIPSEYDGDTALDSTRIIARQVDYAGIISDPDTVTVAVKEGFYPGSIIYIGETYLLGENHFIPYSEPALGKIVPSINTPEGIHYSTPFFIDKDSTYAAIGSDDIKIYLRWGFHGEYNEDNPNLKKQNSVLDEQTDEPYFSEIMYYDIRLDGAPLYYPSIPATGDNLQEDEDGTKWLRVWRSNPIFQNVIITKTMLEHSSDFYGSHTIEIRAVDLQNVGDETPAELTFEISEPVPQEAKDGILIIDDDINQPVFCPDDIVDSIYTYICSDYNGTVDVLDRRELLDEVFPGSQGNPLHFDKDVFSPTDLVSYKLIIYHTDTPQFSSQSYFFSEFDVMNLYLRTGGNILISGGANISKLEESMETESHRLFEKYFGFRLDENLKSAVVPELNGTIANFVNLTFFNHAIEMNGFSSQISLEIEDPFNNTIINSKALGPVSYFQNYYPTDYATNNMFETVEPIFGYGCITPEDLENFDDWDETEDTDGLPSENQYNQYNNKPVALKAINTSGNHCYIFGFPLSYMKTEEVKTMMNVIFEEVGLQ